MNTKNKILIGAGIFSIIVLIILIFTPLLNMKSPEFHINNYDVEKHDVSVALFDSHGILIFNETYIVSPDIRIASPKITDIKDDYFYKVVLDNNITETFESKKEFGVVVIWLYPYESGKIVPIRILQTTD